MLSSYALVLQAVGYISQGGQDHRLKILLRNVLGIHNGSCVEFGFPSVAASNTESLVKYLGWRALRFGANSTRYNSHAEWLTSSNIVEMFRKYNVEPDVDYVSIDVDSAELYLFEAIVSSEYRPKVFTIEYNANYPWGTAIAFPDPANAAHAVSGVEAKFDGGCFYGVSAFAIDLAARKHGYLMVDVEPGFDVFLVRADLWGNRPVPNVEPSIYRPFNANLHNFTDGQQSALIDSAVLQRSGSLIEARQAAAKELQRMRDAQNPCFREFKCLGGTEPRPCKHLHSVVCHETCRKYPTWMPNQIPDPLYLKSLGLDSTHHTSTQLGNRSVAATQTSHQQ